MTVINAQPAYYSMHDYSCTDCGETLYITDSAIQYDLGGGHQIMLCSNCAARFASSFIQDYAEALAEAPQEDLWLKVHNRERVLKAATTIKRTIESITWADNLISGKGGTST